MKNRRIKSKRVKGKLDPIPHNNRKRTAGRMARTQQVTFLADSEGKIVKPEDYRNMPDAQKKLVHTAKRTVHHMNLTPYEERRVHMIKEAISKNDLTVRQKLNLRERKLFDKMLELQNKKDGKENNDTTNPNA